MQEFQFSTMNTVCQELELGMSKTYLKLLPVSAH